ncbi:hypothetical protein Q5752_006527 [Cryptotrichosporon argae]
MPASELAALEPCCPPILFGPVASRSSQGRKNRGKTEGGTPSSELTYAAPSPHGRTPTDAFSCTGSTQ